MYNPRAFREERIEVLHAAMRGLGACTLVSQGPEGLLATHLPIELDPAPAPWGTLRCHLARANPHWQALGPEREVLAIFQGPQGYVSPGWYATKRETGKAVPTWNYVAIHARGTARTYDDPERLLAHVTALTARHEAGRAEPWAPADAPADFIAAQLKAIVGVEVPLAHVEGKWKVSQNRTRADREGVVAGLHAQGDADSRTLADLVQAALDAGGD